MDKDKTIVRHEPGSDKWYVRFTDEESDDLVWNSCWLNECFGLDRRIGNYKGVKPIGLEAWEIEALYEVYSSLLENDPEYDCKDTEPDRYPAMKNLVNTLQILYKEAFGS